jgi:hypothetical protein
MKEILHIIRYGVRSLLACTEGPPDLKTPERTFWALVVLLAFSYTVLGFLYLNKASDWYFDIYVLPDFGLIVACILAAGFVPRLFYSDPRDQIYQLPVVFLSLQIPVMLIEGIVWTMIKYISPDYDINNNLWMTTVVVVEAILLFRAFLLCYGPTVPALQVRLAVTTCLFMGAVYYVSYYTDTPYFINQPYDSSDYKYLNAEETLVPQPELTRRAIADLLPSRPGTVDYYSVLLGGDGSQDVFRKEVLAADNAFAANLSTQGRTVALINNTRTVNTLPLGTLTNLRAVFSGIAEKMQPQEDVLIVYLTSHGGRDSKLSTYLPGISLKTIDAGKIAAALRDAGFKWKVIIISACYSGSYIPVLKDPGTMIITASSVNTTSFGCSATSDMTWFGKAFLIDALPRSHSFEEAYQLVRKSVAAREKEQGLSDSLPQIEMGEQIGDYLHRHSPFTKSR